MNFDEMTARMRDGQGFIAALDQSGGSTPKALQSYGVEDGEWNGDEEMFAKIHEMRCRIVDSPSFSNGKVIGAILFEKTMEGWGRVYRTDSGNIEGEETLRLLEMSGEVFFVAKVGGNAFPVPFK